MEVFFPFDGKLVEEVDLDYRDTDIIKAYKTDIGMIVKNKNGGLKYMTFKEFINYLYAERKRGINNA